MLEIKKLRTKVVLSWVGNNQPMKMSVNSRAVDKELQVNNNLKTSIAISSVLTHNRDKKRTVNVVLCPSHLVEKWKFEIERLAPISDAVIIDNLSALIKLEDKIKNNVSGRHLWLILSKETAKLNYSERPSVVWSKTKKCYCCPVCGRPIYKEYTDGKGSSRKKALYFLSENDFTEKNAINQYCTNKIQVWNQDTCTYEMKECGTKLWQANTDLIAINDSSWIKFGNKVGWYETQHIERLLEELNEEENPTKEDLQKIIEFSNYMRDEIPVQIRPRRYPIAKYIHKYLKGYIDYLVADEIHLMKSGDSLQGEAFGDLASTAKKVICLTGTLVNGYASGIYHILFRAFPNMMKKQGYVYGSAGENKFVNDFGVVEKKYSIEWLNGAKGKRIGQTKRKVLPGISPLVFTKFLLENTAFLSIEDIAAEMPGYKEIPVPIEMDPELKEAYENLSKDVKEHMNFFRYAKLVSQMFNLLSIFPDQPYDQPPIIDIENDGKTIVKPPSITKLEMRNKEERLLELVQTKKSIGEKVLLYYSFVHRTDVTKRLCKILNDNGIKAVILDSKVKSRDRESWINEKISDNIDVLICNPSLVETGLDLLDFRTIIFYQCGYNLYTMRQASRRSWRISQDKDVEVYFLYYQNTVQEQIIALMATKLQAAMAIEGKFNAEGLNAMSNNTDILTQLAANFTDNVKQVVNTEIFEKTSVKNNKIERTTEYKLIKNPRILNRYSIYDHIDKKKKHSSTDSKLMSMIKNPIKLFSLADDIVKIQNIC